MAKRRMKAELHAEAGYLTSQTGENKYRVFKIDPTTESPTILAQHDIANGVCDCAGFKHRSKCRHVDMIQWRPKGIDRIAARSEVTHIINSWADRFDRIVFDEYEFTDADETMVKVVKLKAHGSPISFQGVDHYKITGITKAGVFVVLEIAG